MRLRPLLTKWWKEHHTPFAATACTAEEPFVNHAISWQEVCDIAAAPLQSAAAVTTEAEELAATTLSQGCLDFQKVATVIRSSKLPSRMQPSRECIGHVGQEPFKSWTLGTWRRGGVVGISTLTRERPNLVKLVNQTLQACHPGATWTAITINDGVTVMPHRDSNNEPNTMNMIICLDGAVEGTGGGLWVENPQGGKAFRQIKPGMHLAGEVHNLRHQPLQFDPSLWHGTEPWTGKRLVVTAYTAGLWDKVPEQDRSRRRMLNFHFAIAVRRSSSTAHQRTGQQHQHSQQP